jgi:hypothetical protein
MKGVRRLGVALTTHQLVVLPYGGLTLLHGHRPTAQPFAQMPQFPKAFPFYR